MQLPPLNLFYPYQTLFYCVLPLCVCVCVGSPPRNQMWKDCADAYKAGQSVSGLYHIYIGNRTEPVQVTSDLHLCFMYK